MLSTLRNTARKVDKKAKRQRSQKAITDVNIMFQSLEDSVYGIPNLA